MRTTTALMLVGVNVALACQSAPAEELRLRKVNDHRLIIEGPYGGRKGYIRATPSGRLVIETGSGRRVGSIRPVPGASGRSSWPAPGLPGPH